MDKVWLVTLIVSSRYQLPQDIMSLELSGSKEVLSCGSFDAFDIPVDMRTPLWELAISVALTMQVPEGNAIPCCPWQLYFMRAHCYRLYRGDWYIWYGVSSHLRHGSQQGFSQVSRYVNLSPHNIHTTVLLLGFPPLSELDHLTYENHSHQGTQLPDVPS